MEVRDRFGDHGIVGVTIVSDDAAPTNVADDTAPTPGSATQPRKDDAASRGNRVVGGGNQAVRALHVEASLPSKLTWFGRRTTCMGYTMTHVYGLYDLYGVGVSPNRCTR